MPYKYGMLLVLGALYAPQTVPAQDNRTPIVAKFREIGGVRTAANPVDPKAAEYRGEYFRNSEGSTLLARTPVVNGQERPERTVAVLTDARTGKVTDISYSKRSAVVRQQLRLPLVPLKHAEKDIVGHRAVNGLQCMGLRVTCVNARLSTSGVCGVTWRSVDYDFTVKMEISQPLAGGAERFHVTEMYDIQIGQEPDAAKFEIPSDFAVSYNLVRAPAGVK
ncbi:MAG TPA: hypothetical protein VEU62_18835 [Bryobacterales bacterium]|nr:hypothetical protein [Bryobacterales bacterium]